MLIGTAAVALAALVLVVVVRIGGAGAPTEGVAQDRPGPVLLVTGYGGGTAALDRLAEALRERGREAVVVPVVGDGTGDLRLQTAALAAAADEALAAGAPSVDVVGYSAGGVVARLWAEEDGGAAIARRIVTLGAPHHGAEVAAIGAALVPDSCPEACRQLVPGSELLTGLDETAPGPEWTAVWSADDTVVTPPDSARLAGAVNIELQDVCPNARIGHGQLPTDPLSVAVVALALGVDPLQEAPAATECADLVAAGG